MATWLFETGVDVSLGAGRRRCIKYRNSGGSQVLTSPLHSYLTETVYKIILQKSGPTQIRRLLLYISNSRGSIDGFVGELTSTKRLPKTFV